MTILVSLENRRKKLTAAVALGAAAVAGATVVGTTQANADTRIDSNTIEVTAGDTMSGISAKYGVDMNQLAQSNGVQNPNLIVVGQRLHLNATNNNQQSAQAVQQPAQQQTQTVQSAPAAQSTQASASTQTTNASASNYQAPSFGGSEQAAKDWIASRESGGNYNATNGQYIGKYQLSASYLNGDYSPANQERVANQYVQGRYGSWTAAQSFWQSHGWY